jgi:hypothetical protein
MHAGQVVDQPVWAGWTRWMTPIKLISRARQTYTL